MVVTDRGWVTMFTGAGPGCGFGCPIFAHDYFLKFTCFEHFDQTFDQIVGQVFDQIFGQVFDQVFGQGFDHFLGGGKRPYVQCTVLLGRNKTVYSTIYSDGKIYYTV